MELTEKDIDAETAGRMRKELGLSQREFWGPVGVQQSVSSRYEHGHAEIPLPVRMLIVARYVGKVDLDTSTSDGVKEISRLGKMQSSEKDVQKVFAVLRNDIDKSIRKLTAAREALTIL